MAVTLKNEKIVDNWSMIVKEGQEKVEEVFKDTESLILKSEAPGVKSERVKANPGFLAGVFGSERTFIRVVNKDLKRYEMYIGARAYGKNLDLSWYLTYEPGLIARIIAIVTSRLFPGRAWVPTLNLFQQQDLTAYATVVHHCFLDAIEKITKGTGQEIDRKSRGFLGIS